MNRTKQVKLMDISIYSLQGSFEKVIEYLKGVEAYVNTDFNKNGLYTNIELEVEHEDGNPYIAVNGVRPMTERELQIELEARERQKEYRRQEYERLKKEFGS